jgi:hypothetical protein
MKVASSFTSKFITGFVDSCLAAGMDEDQTELLFHKHASNSILELPEIRKGFERQLGSMEIPLGKAAMLRHMNPDRLALVVNNRLKSGQDLLSVQFRQLTGLSDSEQT